MLISNLIRYNMLLNLDHNHEKIVDGYLKISEGGYVLLYLIPRIKNKVVQLSLPMKPLWIINNIKMNASYLAELWRQNIYDATDRDTVIVPEGVDRQSHVDAIWAQRLGNIQQYAAIFSAHLDFLIQLLWRDLERSKELARYYASTTMPNKRFIQETPSWITDSATWNQEVHPRHL